MESIRLFNPFGGYVLIDLPAYEPALAEERPRVRSGDKDFDLFALLRTQVLAYRELKDEMNYELATAISRAATRAAIVAGGQAVAAAHKETRDMTGLVGLALSLGMEAIAAADARSVRNWETLPAVGYMGMFNLPSGFEITVVMGDRTQTVSMPEQGRGMLLLVTSVGAEQMRVDYVEY